MRIISHRGNLNGPSPKTENKKKTIENCINLGFDVEVDLWFESNKFFLGHDSPDELIDNSIFKSEKIWFHIKNISTLEVIKEFRPKNYFWHEKDVCALTSSGKFWLYPGNYISSNDAIFVLPEQSKIPLEPQQYTCYGICTDFVNRFDSYFQ
jgi:hypothetical protein